jgi:WG containing repeat
MANQKSISIVRSTLRLLVGLSTSIATVSLLPCQVQALPPLGTKVEKMSIEINPERTAVKIPQDTQKIGTKLAQFDTNKRLARSWYIAQTGSTENSDANNSERLVVIQVGKKYGYQNAAGHTAIAARFDNAYDFFEGLAAVNINGKWGYINRSGDLVVAMQFDNAISFCSGLAAVKIDNKWGFVNRQGVAEIALSFDEVESFSEGLAKVKVGNKWGFIDRKGVMKIEPTFDEAASFNDSAAWVRIGKQVGYIDRSGKFMITSS